MVQDFKTAAGIAQTLSKTLTEVASREMLAELKNVKTRLSSAKTKCVERQGEIKPVPPQVESLETGLGDLNDWLTEGESLVNSHSLDGSIDLIDERLKRQRVCLFIRLKFCILAWV